MSNSPSDVEKPGNILRDSISSTRTFFNRVFTTARAHSPFAADKLEAVDDAVSGVIHTGYQAVKRIAVHGHPSVILSVTAIAAAAPSLPFGPRAVIRNAGLAVGLAAVMIYPDHLRSVAVSRPTDPSAQKS